MTFDARAKTYSIWKAMNKRCRKQADYVAKGVQVCQEWQATCRDGKAFQAFVSHVGMCPSPDHSIDRYPNREGNYEPGNVRWATREQQNNNKSDNRYITYEGQTKTMSEWAVSLGLSYYVIRARLRLGWEIPAALTTPVGGKPPKSNKYLYADKLMTITEIANTTGIPEPTLRARLGKGETITEAVVKERNRKNARYVTAFGRTQTVTEWAKETGINANTLRSRILYNGIPPEDALTKKIPSH